MRTDQNTSSFWSVTGLVSVVLTVLLVLVFAKLGLWQLDRAKEKVAMLDARVAAQARPPLDSLEGGFTSDDIYRELKLTGSFDFTKQFLLDNRLHKRQPGFEVLTPFYLDKQNDTSQAVIMVNRGWVAGNADRSIKPVLDNFAELSKGPGSLSGLLVTPSKGITLGDATDETDHQWPKIIQYPDYGTIAQKLDRIEVINAVIIAAPNQAGNYLYNWQPIAHGPEKHYGYAFQWFAMLLAVLTLFVYLNFIKKDE